MPQKDKKEQTKKNFFKMLRRYILIKDLFN